MSHAFDRYSDLTDLKLLNEASAKPLRKSMRVNTLKATPAEFISWAKYKDWTIQPVPFCPEGFFVDRVNREEALGKDLFHVLGNTYMQEAASMLPVVLLDPKPGQTVLDMSAAPGSKTTQIAARMQQQGLLIASDVQEKRIWSLISNLQRCGVVNAVVIRKVGQWFAGNMTEVFDCVLCDAPCTAQGTVRKDSDALTYCSMENVGKMAKLQRELLESAVHAAKVGGRIVYSTCTLTPEENEGVIASILNKFSDQVSVVDPLTIVPSLAQGVKDSKHVQEWMKAHHSSLIPHLFPALRLWPQTYDTEGFFSAVLMKHAPTRDTKRYREEPHRWDALSQSKANEVKARLVDWYGTDFLRDDEVLIESKEQLLAAPAALLSFGLHTKPYLTGLPFGKATLHGLPRLSHEMATLRGHMAKQQVVLLTDDAFTGAFQGRDVQFAAEGIDDGDVILTKASPAIGRPLTIGRGMLKGGRILNRLPREIVRMFT